MTLKHGKAGRGGRKTRASAKLTSITARDNGEVQSQKKLHLLKENLPVGVNIDTNSHYTFQAGILDQSVDQSSNESHSAGDSSPVPFSPFPWGNYGQNLEWIFQTPKGSGTDDGISETQVDNIAASLPIKSPHDKLSEDPIQRYFPISEQTHNNLISFISLEDVDGSLIPSIEETRRILDNAIRYLESCLPIFHRPTLNLEFATKELTTSFFIIGLLISGYVTAHKIGCKLLRRLRGDLLQLAQDIAIEEENLWVLQSMLLLEFAGMFHADRTAIKSSDIFHGTLVTLARRLGIFESHYDIAQPILKCAADRRWAEWIQKETSKRLAYFIFVIDVQHSLLFGHDQSIISVFTIRLDLPCSAKEWYATSSHEWASHMWASYTAMLCHRKLKFHQIHQLLLSVLDIHNLPSIDTLSAYLVLTGVASSTCDYLQRQHDPFFDREQARHNLRILLKAVSDQIATMAVEPFRNHGLTTYYISMICLDSGLGDLQLAAKSLSSLIRVTPKEQTRTAIAHLLPCDKVGPDTALHAVQLLRMYFVESYSSVMPLESSALYLGALTLWAYTIGRADEYENLDMEHKISGEDVLAEMEAAITDSSNKKRLRASKAVFRQVSERLAALQNDNAREYSEVLCGIGDLIV